MKDLRPLDFSEEFEQAHPIIATAGYIGETIIIALVAFLACYAMVLLLMWASA